MLREAPEETTRPDAVARAEIGEDHWAILALTRFFLALIVVHVHYRLVLGPPYDHPVSRVAMGLGGSAAVYGFLLISGFSIAHSIRHQPEGFYRRRIARVWPVLLAGVVIYLLGAFAYARWQVTASNLLVAIPTLLFLNGFVAPLWLAPTWSLSIEVFFYLAAPLLCRSIGLISVLIAASAIIYFFSSSLGLGPYAVSNFGIGAVGVFWAWGTGFLNQVYFRSATLKLFTFVIGPLLMGAYGSGDGPYAAVTWAVAAFAVTFGGVFALSTRGRALTTYLGDLSYPLFLTHLGTQTLAVTYGFKSWFIVFPLYLIVADLTLRIIDRPARRFFSNSQLLGSNAERFALPATIAVIVGCVAAYLISRASH